MIESLVKLSRLETGIIHINIKKQPLQYIFDAIKTQFQAIASRKEIHFEVPDTDETAAFDIKWAIEAIANVVDNAIKYTPADSCIQITAVRHDDAVALYVYDNGPGIPDELKERVFEMFFTGGNPIGDSRRSLGLGLTLCQAIIHAHNGEITLKDNSPHGCIFSFTVPLSEVNLNE